MCFPPSFHKAKNSVADVEHSRLLDLLLDVNNSAQIPPEKRIDLSHDVPSDDDALCLDIDLPSTPPADPKPAHSFRELLQEVPHYKFASAAERSPELLADLEAGRDSPADPAQGQSHPPSFLTADDIDNYIWEIDAYLRADEFVRSRGGNTESTPLPTLAPLAHAERAAAANPKDAQRDFALRNPTSVYNWLRKHAPKTFLQDGEHDNKDGAGGGKENGGGDDSHGGHGHGPGSGRRGKGERGSRGGAGGARSKRASAAHSRSVAAAAAEGVEDVDDESGYGGGGGRAATPSTVGGGGGGKGKRKRVVDDDPGYRPKGGSSRPTKKKRKSEGVEKTPTARGPRKSATATGWD